MSNVILSEFIIFFTYIYLSWTTARTNRSSSACNRIFGRCNEEIGTNCIDRSTKLLAWNYFIIITQLLVEPVTNQWKCIFCVLTVNVIWREKKILSFGSVATVSLMLPIAVVAEPQTFWVAGGYWDRMVAAAPTVSLTARKSTGGIFAPKYHVLITIVLFWNSRGCKWFTWKFILGNSATWLVNG